MDFGAFWVMRPCEFQGTLIHGALCMIRFVELSCESAMHRVTYLYSKRSMSCLLLIGLAGCSARWLLGLLVTLASLAQTSRSRVCSQGCNGYSRQPTHYSVLLPPFQFPFP